MNKIITLSSFLDANLCHMINVPSSIEFWGKEFISELILFLLCSSYSEEGRQLFLDIFLVNNLEDFLKIIPDSNYIAIGTVDPDQNGAKIALKKCAPLARGCWRLFFTKDISGNKIQFGIFRDMGNKLNTPLENIVNDIDPEYTSLIHISYSSNDAVRIVNNNGYKAILHLSNSPESAIDVEAIGNLVSVICKDVIDPQKMACSFYLNHLLPRAFRESHGVLLVVIKGDNIPECLNDNISLDLAQCFSEAIEASQKQSIDSSIRAIEDIFFGVLQCDGAVVLNTQSKLLAYNAFTSSIKQGVSGGARRRAFEGLCSCKDPSIEAVFYQSQDGLNELWRQQ